MRLSSSLEGICVLGLDAVLGASMARMHMEIYDASTTRSSRGMRDEAGCLRANVWGDGDFGHQEAPPLPRPLPLPLPLPRPPPEPPSAASLGAVVVIGDDAALSAVACA